MRVRERVRVRVRVIIRVRVRVGLRSRVKGCLERTYDRLRSDKAEGTPSHSSCQGKGYRVRVRQWGEVLKGSRWEF